jgi:hypothetical protein
MVSRSVVIALVLLFCAAGTVASEGPELSDIPLTNWPTPPFWAAGVPAPEGEDSLEKAGIPSPPLPFVAVPPCRVADTRGNGAPIQGGAFTGPADVRNWTVIGACGIPAGAEAVSANFTVVGPAAAGFLVAWPMGGAVPPVSVLNFNAGQTVANAAIVPLGTGAMTVNVSASTHVILDVNGYFGGAVTEVQQRVTGTCAAGSSIRVISATGTVTCEADDAGPAGWSLTGNAGTNPTTNFLGTTDNQAVEIRVNGVRRLRLQPNDSIIAGSSANSIFSAANNSVISGGGGSGGEENRAFDTFNTIAGGRQNTAGSDNGSPTSSSFATVSGGVANTASGHSSVIGGGSANTATGDSSTIGGGGQNMTSGSLGTIPGGSQNFATSFAFAAGNRAIADDSGAFVWADFNPFDFNSTAGNQFNVRAVGGSRFVSAIDGAGVPTAGVVLAAGGNAWAPLSDRGAKENFCDVDEDTVLERLAAVPIETWNLKSQDPSIRHIGPMAQDFAAAFGVGEYGDRITTSDADGVAFAAIQALYRKLQAQEGRIRELEARLAQSAAREN